MSNKYQFIERVYVYYTVEANSEEEAWEKLPELDPPYYKSCDHDVSFEVEECWIENVWEFENA